MSSSPTSSVRSVTPVDKGKMGFALSYIETGSVLHRLSGVTKLILFLWWITLMLTTFDLRVTLGFCGAGILLLGLARIPFRVYRPFVLLMIYLVVLNCLFIFLFAPLQGPKLIGSTTVLFTISPRYVVTAETLVYLAVVGSKLLAIFPVALLFVFTTHPSEFAAGLNRIGVPYKIAYMVSLTLRYLPEITKDFVNILHAQQARGIDISRKTPLARRVKNVAGILFPLLLASLERAEVIADAMSLRGFGKGRRRSWYSARPPAKADWLVFAVTALWTALHFLIRSSLDGLFWYPYS